MFGKRPSTGSVRKKPPALTMPMSITLLALALLVPTLSSCVHQEPNELYQPPSLYIECLSGTVQAFRNAFTWPVSPQEVRQVERKEMPPKPVYGMATAPGEKLDFTLKGCGEKPRSIALELVDAWVFSDPGAGKPVYSAAVDNMSLSKEEITFSWTVPPGGVEPLGVPSNEEGRYCLKIDVSWDNDNAKAPGTTEPLHVEYIARLAIADKVLIERAMQIPREMFRAAWDGNKEAIAPLLSDAWFAGGVKAGHYHANPFDVRLDSPWDSILWSSDDLGFSLASEPDVRLVDFRNHPLEPYARVNVNYIVRVTDKSGKSGLWDFEESYGLHLGDPDKTPVSFMDRRGEPGFDERTPAEWTPRVSQEGQVTKAGPFYDLSWPYDVWSDDGMYLPFIADESAGDAAIWVISRDGLELKRLHSPDKPEAPVSPSYLSLLGWAPNEHKVRFSISGYQPGPGPHAEDCGLWFGEVDVSTGETRSIAFIRSQQWRAWNVHVTRDRSHVIFRDPNDLWRVNLVTGETVKLAENVRPLGYDLFNLRFSPSGWHAAYLAWEWEEDQYSLVVYDMKTGARTDIPLPGNHWDLVQDRPFFLSWTPDGLLTVGLAAKEDIAGGPDSDYAAGFQKLLFYSPDGTLQREIQHEGAIIGARAWTESADRLAYSLVAVSKANRPDPTHQWDQGFQCELKEIWVQEASGRAPYKIASLTDQPNAMFAFMNWVDGDSAVEMWFSPDYENPGEDRRGIRVGMDGQIALLLEPSNRLGVARPCGAIGQATYYVQRNQDDTRVFAVDASGNETVIYQGTARDDIAEVQSEVFVLVVTESRWGMLGRRGYILFHRP